MKVKRNSLETKNNENINAEIVEKNKTSADTGTKNALAAATTTKENPSVSAALITPANEDKEKQNLDLPKGGGSVLKIETDLEETKPLTRSSAGATSMDAIVKQDDEDKANNKSDVVKIEENSMTSPTMKTSTNSNAGPSAKTTSGNKKKRNAILEDLELSDEEHYNRLKRRKIKVAGAPKLPLTGYVRYMNERREVLKKSHPNKTATEHTKMISEEWHHLSEEIKAPYINAAAIDKQRYEDELNSFLKANPNVLADELAKNKQSKAKSNENKATVLKEKSLSSENLKVPAAKDQKVKQNLQDIKPVTSATSNDLLKNVPTTTNGLLKTNENCAIFSTKTPGEIPIFTNEFLEHNKLFDTEFRTLRKSKQELEQENSVLEQHVENMKVGVKKMTEENNQLQEKNKFLEIYLEKLKKKLAGALAGLALPNVPNGATEDNIEQYLEQLYEMVTTNTHGPACLNKAKDILRKLDMQIQL